MVSNGTLVRDEMKHKRDEQIFLFFKKQSGRLPRLFSFFQTTCNAPNSQRRAKYAKIQGCESTSRESWLRLNLYCNDILPWKKIVDLLWNNRRAFHPIPDRVIELTKSNHAIEARLKQSMIRWFTNCETKSTRNCSRISWVASRSINPDVCLFQVYVIMEQNLPKKFTWLKSAREYKSGIIKDREWAWKRERERENVLILRCNV